MKKMAIIVSSLLVSSIYADSLADALKDGKVNGQVRAFFIDRDYNGIKDTHRNAFALGGNLAYESAKLNGFTLGVKFYTTNGLGINGDDKSEGKVDPTLFKDDYKSYSILGEAYIGYSNNKTSVKVGRQKLDTPLAASDDARMLPNLFEAVVVTNSNIENITLVGAHVSKMAAGTFSNAYGNSGVDENGITSGGYLALHSGYGLNNQSGKFMKMGTYAINQDTNGVTAIAGIYSKDNLKFQLWDYYAHDILNAIYIDGTYSWNCLVNKDIKMSASAQYLNESEVGDKLAGDIDSDYMAVKLGASHKILSAYVAYSTTDSSSGTTNGGIISPWGGMPAYTQGMVTRHQFFADTDATKVAITLKPMKPLSITGYYTTYDIGESNAYKNGVSWDASEFGFDTIYKPTKELKLRFRGNFPRDFASGLDWNEYRLIAYYNF